MGGEFRIRLYSERPEDQVIKIFQLAQNEVQRIEDKFTDFKESEFNKINENAGKSPVSVDAETWSLLKRAQSISQDSDGIFDISYASLGHLWREAKRKNIQLTKQERQKASQYIDYKKIEFNKAQKSIFLPHTEMKIGLGGIGKGYAVDRVYELLSEDGFQNFYINGSGDIRVSSSQKAPRPWRIGIRNPFSEDPAKSAGYIQLTTGSVASSGSYINKNRLKVSQNIEHHIINPKSSNSENHIISSTVLASDTVTADTTATIIMNLNISQAIQYLDDRNLCGLVINTAGKSFLSKKAISYFGLKS